MCTLFDTHMHAVSCAETEMQHPTHSDGMKTWDHLHTLQLLLDSPDLLHLLFIFPNPFVFPCSVHIRSTAATLSFFSLFHLHKMFLFWTSPQSLRHDPKILYNSVHVITHLLKWIHCGALRVNYGIIATLHLCCPFSCSQQQTRH